MQKLDNWKAVSSTAASKGLPVVVMVDQDHCPYCRQVESEFFAAILAGGDYENKVIFGKISIDEGETIIDGEGIRIPTRQFLGQYNADFTPTILFVDAKKNELAEKIIGLATPDYYVYYLEKAIQQSMEIVASRI